MTLKKWKVISVVGIFLFSALLHFIYDWFPNFFTSLFFPVNESIGEHNKIIVGSFLFWAIIEKIYYKKKKECNIRRMYFFSSLHDFSYAYFYSSVFIYFKN